MGFSTNNFLQSSAWGKFQKSLGRKIWQINIKKDVSALVVKHSLPFSKSYLYCPRGPQVKNSSSLELFFNKIKEIAKKENAIFLKIEPICQLPVTNYQLLKPSKTIQPQKTIVLDITKSEEELLKQMHQKTRYNIRLAQKKDIKLEIIDKPNENDIENFWHLANQTAGRDKFKLYPKIYYQKMLSILPQEGIAKLYLAKFEDKIIAANIICFYNQTAYYLHGSSDYDARNLMAPHFIQWQAILKAKMMGLKYYDFCGIDEVKWPGITRFKKGFSQREIEYPGAYDLVFQKSWYKIYNLAKSLRQ